ncbi:hypothetical protein ACMC56_08775 [Campylobacterota bacterium DY0563]
MRILLILFTFITFSFSANLLYLENKNNSGINTYCIDDSYYYQSDRLFFHDILNNNDLNLYTSNYQKILIIPGYDVENANCYINESKYLGLSYEQYVFLMSLTGLLCGSLLASIILYKVL